MGRKASPRLVLLCLLFSAGCTADLLPRDKEGQEQRAARRQEEQKEAAAQALREKEAADRRQAEAVKASVRTNPSSWIEMTGAQIYDGGIFASQREVTSLTLLNKSKFAVRYISGEVVWKKGGAAVGSTAFSLTGSIPAGGTVVFSKAAGTLSGSTLQTDAKEYHVVVKQLALVE